MLSFIRKHPIGVGAGTAVVIAGLAWLAFGFFGVQTLFIDDVVDEAGPAFDASPGARETEPGGGSTTAQVATAPAPATPDESAPAPTPTETTEMTEPVDQSAAPEIVTELTGTFQGDAHPTAGTANVLGNGTGQRFLRLENFETDNGPDLNVYLVNSSTGDVSDYIDLGDLKGNIGDQNYEIPEGADLSIYDEVVIWCVRFGVGFGDALLMPV